MSRKRKSLTLSEKRRLAGAKGLKTRWAKPVAKVKQAKVLKKLHDDPTFKRAHQIGMRVRYSKPKE